jgi:ATP-dependent Clp protease protease subunit
VESKIYIDGYIGNESGSFSLADLNRKLDTLSNATEIDVYINSGGGSVTEGFAIYDRLMAFNGVVNTIVNGMCGSIATVIFQAGKKGKRKMYVNAEFFVHNPIWIPQAPEAMEAKDIASLHEDLIAAENRIKGFYANITGKGIDELTPMLDRQTTLLVDEAIAWGFVDEKVSTEIKAYTKYQIAAYLNHNTKKTEMSQVITDEIKNEFTGLKSFLNKLTKKLFKNMKVTTDEGVDVYYDADTVDVGTSLYIDEAMTEKAPDGKHTISEKVYVTVDGVVTEVLEVEAVEDVAALKAEIEKMKGELTAKDAVVNEKENLIIEAKKSINEFSAKVATFEKMIVTGAGEDFKGTQFQGKQDATTELSAMEQVVALRKARAEKK